MIHIFYKIFLFSMIAIFFTTCYSNQDNPVDVEKAIPKKDVEVISPQKEYTKESSGIWKELAEDHLPEILWDDSKSEKNITVKVHGKTFTERHHIEVIGIFDENWIDIDTKSIKKDDALTVTLSLDRSKYNPDKVKVFVKCNLHDLWTAPLIRKTP
jgi:desulfoferrodoxin (superoxide reductase-like protein)